MIKNRPGLLGALGVALSSLERRFRAKPVMMSKPKLEDNWKGGNSLYTRGRDYSASIQRSKYMPHQSDREKERRRIGGFHTRHDHTLKLIADEHGGWLPNGRRCPVCDKEAA